MLKKNPPWLTLHKILWIVILIAIFFLFRNFFGEIYNRIDEVINTIINTVISNCRSTAGVAIEKVEEIVKKVKSVIILILSTHVGASAINIIHDYSNSYFLKKNLILGFLIIILFIAFH